MAIEWNDPKPGEVYRRDKYVICVSGLREVTVKPPHGREGHYLSMETLYSDDDADEFFLYVKRDSDLGKKLRAEFNLAENGGYGAMIELECTTYFNMQEHPWMTITGLKGY